MGVLGGVKPNVKKSNGGVVLYVPQKLIYAKRDKN